MAHVRHFVKFAGWGIAMGVFGWIAGKWLVRDTRRKCRSVRSLPVADARIAVETLVGLMARRRPHLIGEEATRLRHRALNSGSHFTDPVWLAACLAENWATARAGDGHGRVRGRWAAVEKLIRDAVVEIADSATAAAAFDPPPGTLPLVPPYAWINPGLPPPEWAVAQDERGLIRGSAAPKPPALPKRG